MRPERAWSDLVAILAPSYAVEDLFIEDWLIAVICEAHKLAGIVGAKMAAMEWLTLVQLVARPSLFIVLDSREDGRTDDQLCIVQSLNRVRRSMFDGRT